MSDPAAVDWTVILQETIASDVDPEVVDVYSDVDPQRRWEGKTIVEIGLRSIDNRRYIDGTRKRTFNFSCFIRAKTYEEAFEASWRLGNYVIPRELLQRRLSGLCEAFAIEDIGVENDVIDKTSGASFTGYVIFKIIEPIVAF